MNVSWTHTRAQMQGRWGAASPTVHASRPDPNLGRVRTVTTTCGVVFAAHDCYAPDDAVVTCKRCLRSVAKAAAQPVTDQGYSSRREKDAEGRS